MTVLSQLVAQVTNVPPYLYAVLAVVTVLYLKTRKRLPDNLPPFPVRPYPILGHIPMLNKPEGTIKVLKNWRKSTGDIYSIYIGSRLFIVMSSWETLKEAFVKKGEYFSDRPTGGLITQREIKNGGLKGIIGNNGAGWKEQRSVSMQILRNFGMGKNWLAEKVSEEVQAYLDTLSKLKGEPKDVRLLTIATVSNVICAILIGRRFETDDQHFVQLLELINEQVVLVTNTGILNVFPMLKHLPGDMFKAKKILKNMDHLQKLFSEKFIQEAKEHGNMNNFVGSYLDEVDHKKESGTPTTLDEVNLTRVMTNLFIAGSETTSTTVLWALVFAVNNPQAQEKFYQEIVKTVGEDKPPSMLEKPKMNYINAYIMETQRIGSIVPLSLMHMCTADIEVGGYTIPSGATIIPNLDEVLKDEKTWGDPMVFRPERFLDKDNKLVVPEQFIPFSIGRRYCMGESLARMELFLFLTAMIQRFHILPEDPENLPPPEPIFGTTSAPKAFKVRLVERKEERRALDLNC